MPASSPILALLACLGMLLQAMPAAWCPACPDATPAGGGEPATGCCCCAADADAERPRDETHLPGHCDDDCSCPTCATAALPFVAVVHAVAPPPARRSAPIVELASRPESVTGSGPFHPPRA